MQLIDGKALAASIRKEVASDVRTSGLNPRLNVMLVGNDPASHLYVSLKKKAGEEAGIRVDVHGFEATVDELELLSTIDAWNADPDVDAILIQLPLPYGFDETRIVSRMDPEKDADGFHPKTVEALMTGEPTIVSPVHEGVLRLIAQTDLKMSGAQAIILANSRVFADPLARLLSTAGASADVMSPDDLDRERLKEADIVVTAIGRAGFVHARMVKDDAVIIDVGTSKNDEGKTVGDADFESFRDTDCRITPVPGGVGPMTIALLLRNVVKLAAKREARI
ncbi:bifunctional 5,10-methylenetetrahydrofolate dehydrogenase/5,10-methenyltetrahydrofolate cyclohydrolase [Candidatus Uhrbacteria bacterium]|nr:MAG: bifunctional 5,10-methylenetetrahydrofolate dehydrogenase/5,10-methenyltetrahydrofolate cyclohydrolase [Candidatus Uhrbacteria bacterium]